MMIESLLIIFIAIFYQIGANLAIPMTDSDFNCVEFSHSSFIDREYLNTHSSFDRSFVNTSRKNLRAPCFNASFPTSLTVEEGNDIVLPCVVHNVDFNSIVMSWWKEKAVRAIAVGDNIRDKRFSIDRSVRGGWSLRISNVTFRDSGVYICQINSKQLRERFITLSVTAKRPQIIDLSNNDVLVEDEAVHPSQLPNYNPKGAVWKPFLPMEGFNWNQMQTSSASSLPRLIPLILTTYITQFLVIPTT